MSTKETEIKEEKNKEVEKPTSVKEFINDEQAIAVARQSADSIKSTCGDGWFDIFEIVNKFGIGLSDALQKMEALKLFGFIHERMPDGKEKQYKVVLSDSHRLVLVKQDIDFYEKKIVILKKQEKKLTEKIAGKKKQ